MRKLILSVIMGVVFLFSSLNVSAESLKAASAINTAELESGVINASYTAEGKKLKVMIEKDSKRYTYNLKNDGTLESFPLQMGNGEYKVSILENIEGNSYRYLTTDKVELRLEDQNEVYLSSVQNVNWTLENEAVKKAAELTKGLKSDNEKLEVIYKYVVNNFSYDFDKLKDLKSDYLPDIDLTLNSHKGICYDYSSVFAAMLRSQGIPAKLVKGYTPNAKGYHAWNEVYNSKTKSWMVIDTTYDSQLRAAKLKYSMEKKADQYTKVNEY